MSRNVLKKVCRLKPNRKEGQENGYERSKVRDRGISDRETFFLCKTRDSYPFLFVRIIRYIVRMNRFMPHKTSCTDKEKLLFFSLTSCVGWHRYTRTRSVRSALQAANLCLIISMGLNRKWIDFEGENGFWLCLSSWN